jgi:enoyl-CoA hydratase/carnithine racemase
MLADLEMRGPIAVITMSDDAKRNALSRRLINDVHGAMDKAIAQGMRAMVLASSARVFCAGGDLDELLNSGWLEDRSRADPSYEGFISSLDLPERLTRYPYPVVAAVDGAALGGGFELTLCCDAVVASPRAQFGLPEAGIGLTPSVALTRLPALIGKRATLELALTQRRITADEAKTLGLVNQIADSTKLVNTAVQLAGDMVANTSPASVATIKRLLEEHTPMGWRDISRTMDTLSIDEWREGLKAFLEKRKPDFSPMWETASREAPTNGKAGKA